MSGVRTIRTELISRDEVTQVREETDQEKVLDLKAAYEREEKIDPIVLFTEHTKEAGVIYRIADGWHRFQAQVLLGWVVISAIIREGTENDALAFALLANTGHGKELTANDNRKRITIILTRFPDWRAKGDREIQRHLKMRHHDLVSRVRKELEDAGTIEKVTERTVTRGGTEFVQKEKTTLEKEEPQSQLDLIPTKPIRPKTAAKCQYEGCIRLAYDGVHCMEHIPKSPTPTESSASALPSSQSSTVTAPAQTFQLDRLFGDLEREYSIIREWTCTVDVVGRKSSRSLSITQALSVLPPHAVVTRHDMSVSNSEVFFGTQIKDAMMGADLCWFIAKAPKKKEPAGDEDSSPAKTNGSWQHYNTPPELCDLLRLVAPIGLDPCHNSGSFMRARVTFDEAQNGLDEKHDWSALAKGELIPVNCPWANPTPWVNRICEEAAKPYTQLVLIVSSGSTSSKWWHKATQSCSVRVELSDRVPYYKDGVPDPNPRDSTVLFYWGPLAARFAAVFAPHGAVLRVAPESFYEAEAAKLRHEELTSKQGSLPILEATPKESTIQCKKCQEKIQEKDSWHAGHDKGPYCEGCARYLCGQQDATPFIESFQRRKQAEATPEASDPGTWIARSLNQLKACTTREEFDLLHKSIMEKASDDEVMSIVNEVVELRAKLPSAANVKPSELKKEEAPKEPRRGGVEKMQLCSVCLEETPLSVSRLYRAHPICQSCFTLRLTGNTARGYVTAKGAEVIRFGVTFTKERQAVELEQSEFEALKKDKRFSVQWMGGSGQTMDWERHDYWVKVHLDGLPWTDTLRIAEVYLDLVEHEKLVQTEKTEKLCVIEVWANYGKVQRSKKTFNVDAPVIVHVTREEAKDWFDDGRLRVRLLKWFEFGSKKMEACTDYHKGLAIYDVMIEACRTNEDFDKTKKLWADWREKQPRAIKEEAEETCSQCESTDALEDCGPVMGLRCKRHLPESAKKKPIAPNRKKNAMEKTRSLGVSLKKPAGKKAGRR